MNQLGGNNIREPFIGDLTQSKDRQVAIQAMLNGQPVAVDNDSVGALCGDGANADFIERVYSLKERERNKPVGALKPFSQFFPLVDQSLVHESFLPYLQDPVPLQAALGGITFIKAPLNREKVLLTDFPASMLSQDPSGTIYGQTYDAAGKTHFAALVAEMLESGIQFPAVTSLNQSGDPELHTAEDFRAFTAQKQLMLLEDPTAQRLIGGSFNIIEFHKDGWSMVRESNIPTSVIRELMPQEIPYVGREDIRQSAYPQLQLSYDDFKEHVGNIRLGDELRTYLGWSAIHHTKL